MIGLMSVKRRGVTLELKVGKTPTDNEIKFWLIVNERSRAMVVDLATIKPVDFMEAINLATTKGVLRAAFTFSETRRGEIITKKPGEQYTLVLESDHGGMAGRIYVELRLTELTKLYELIRDFHPS